MFGIGWTEFIVIAFVLLIFVGPRHLPGVLRKVGLVINELKNASRELRNQVSEEVRELEQVVGTVKHPKAYMADLGREITDEVGSPYDEIYKTEAAVKEEISTIKKDIRGSMEQDTEQEQDRTSDTADAAAAEKSPAEKSPRDKEASS